jgi:hypothetical protein
LLLKTVWLAPSAEALMASFEALRDTYLAGVNFEAAAPLSRRAAALVAAVLLARVDGKSPADYLDAASRAEIRRRAKAMLWRTDLALERLPETWRGLAGA